MDIGFLCGSSLDINGSAIDADHDSGRFVVSLTIGLGDLVLTPAPILYANRVATCSLSVTLKVVPVTQPLAKVRISSSLIPSSSSFPRQITRTLLYCQVRHLSPLQPPLTLFHQLAAETTSDLITTACISWCLIRSKTGWSSTDTTINKLLIIVAESQLPPTILYVSHPSPLKLAITEYDMCRAGVFLIVHSLYPHKTYAAFFVYVVYSALPWYREGADEEITVVASRKFMSCVCSWL
jgi:hypothetical protein